MPTHSLPSFASRSFMRSATACTLEFVCGFNTLRCAVPALLMLPAPLWTSHARAEGGPLEWTDGGYCGEGAA